MANTTTGTAASNRQNAQTRGTSRRNGLRNGLHKFGWWGGGFFLTSMLIWFAFDLKGPSDSTTATSPSAPHFARPSEPEAPKCTHERRLEVTQKEWVHAYYTPGCKLRWKRTAHTGTVLVRYNLDEDEKKFDRWPRPGVKMRPAEKLETVSFKLEEGTGEVVVVIVGDMPKTK